MAKVIYGLIDKSPAVIFLDYVCSHNHDLLCTDIPSFLTDPSESVLSTCNQHKIHSPLCIFICNLLQLEPETS